MKRLNKWYQNIKMTYKMLAGFLAMALITVIVGTVGIVNVSKTQTADNMLYRENTLGIQYCSEVLSNFEQLRYTALTLATLKDSGNALNLVSEMENYYAETEDALQSFEDVVISEEIRTLCDSIKSDWSNYRAYMTKAIQLIRTDQYSAAKNVILNDSDQTGIPFRPTL